MANPMFAIATYNPTPAKSIHDLRAIQRHNNREEPLPHVRPDGPRPLHFIGSGDVVQDVTKVLQKVGIDIQRRRSNGVLAFELVLTASHEFFAHGSSAECNARLHEWCDKQIDFLFRKFNKQIATAVLHLDEHTPHVHAVLVPVVLKNPGTPDADWALIGRSLSGPGEWERLQTDYAEAMAELGLQRGRPGSERKRRPYAEVLAELDQAQKEAAEAERKAKAAAEEAENEKAEYRARVESAAADRDRVLRLEVLLREKEKALSARERQISVREANIRTVAANLETEQEALASDRREFADDRQSLNMSRDALKVKEQGLAKRAELVERDLETFDAIFDGLDMSVTLAVEFYNALRDVRTADLTPEAILALQKTSLLASTLSEVKIPASASSNVAGVAHRLKQTKNLIR